MYQPTRRDQIKDNVVYGMGVVVCLTLALLGYYLSQLAGLAAGIPVYLYVGAFFAQRTLIIRSQLSALTNEDNRWNACWLLMWPMLWALVNYDDFPIMQGDEAKLVKSRGMTGVIEQMAAATRIQLFVNGAPRLPDETYPVRRRHTAGRE